MNDKKSPTDSLAPPKTVWVVWSSNWERSMGSVACCGSRRAAQAYADRLRSVGNAVEAIIRYDAAPEKPKKRKKRGKP